MKIKKASFSVTKEIIKLFLVRNNLMPICMKFTPLLIALAMLAGCNFSDHEKETQAKEEEKVILGKANIKLKAEEFVRVQDYTGEGFSLRNSHRTKDIINGKEEEIEEAVVNFFQTRYKSDIKVHAIHPAVDAAAVYVESIGDPHFYTYAIVPIDVRNKILKTDNVSTQGREVESGIAMGMYAMMYEEEFANLDAYLEELVAENPITGLRKETVGRVEANGYSNSYYFVDTTADDLKDLVNAYLQNPNISKEEIKVKFADYFKPEKITIAITLYMKEDDQAPDEALYDKIMTDIKEMDNIPFGTYYLQIHDNLINARVSDATKASTLDKTGMDGILKK